MIAIFLSTLSLRRATRIATIRRQTASISIHALLAESDLSVAAHFGRRKLISIHALLAESDGILYLEVLIMQNFYPRSPCGERHTGEHLEVIKIDISIHALLAESDTF